MTSVAIIGTAGRDKERTYDLDLWCKMWADACKRFSEGKVYHIVSGGAAWADHLAVELFLAKKAEKLTLHFPAPFKRGVFFGPSDSSASAANYYHEKFTKATGIDSRRQLQEAIQTSGCDYTDQPPASGYGGMFARNLLVAEDVEACLAYTWGAGQEPADGGTKFTWDKITGRKVHVSLASLVQR